jgi:hypothetical protein
MTPDQLFAEALRLPEAERSALAARLIESLESTADPDAEPAWDEEIRQRLRELDSGSVRQVPWAEARRLILESTDDSSES